MRQNNNNKNISLVNSDKKSDLSNVSKLIEDNANFEKIKTVPKNRWFNSSMVVLLGIIGIMLGITFGCLMVIFI